MATALDTLAFMETLKAGGVQEAEAKAITQAFAHATSQELVTKGDLEHGLAGIRKALAEFKVDLRKEIGEIRADLFKWGALAFLGQAGLITALVKLL